MRITVIILSLALLITWAVALVDYQQLVDTRLQLDQARDQVRAQQGIISWLAGQLDLAHGAGEPDPGQGAGGDIRIQEIPTPWY